MNQPITALLIACSCALTCSPSRAEAPAVEARSEQGTAAHEPPSTTSQAGSRRGTDEENGVRLEVFALLQEVGGVEVETERFVTTECVLEIRTLVTNVSGKANTLPTSSFTGHPTGWGGSVKQKFVCFSVGYRLLGERIEQPSPVKFAPVDLQPGESAELPIYEVKIPLDEKDELERVRVQFVVDSDYAAKHGWWSGELELVEEVAR